MQRSCSRFDSFLLSWLVNSSSPKGKGNGSHKKANIFKKEAERYAQLEEKILPSIPRIFVASQIDKERIRSRYSCQNVEVLPNTVAIPSVVSKKTADTPFTFLFVGTLAYYPNFDGILFFCREVLPIIRRKAQQNFIVKIVGSRPPSKLFSELEKYPEVEFSANVHTLSAYYDFSDAMIVPLRAGGGTRIKILEAFAYQRPVISTSIVAEGLSAKHMEHLLLADTKESFAHCCLEIIHNEKLGDLLVKNSRELVQNNFKPV